MSRLKNGATEYARVESLSGIWVAAEIDHGSAGHRFATWRMDPEGNTFWGHYFDTRDEASRDLLARAVRVV